MCTLIALHRCVEDSTLVVAANRDEFLERPTEGPALRDTSTAAPDLPSTRIVAPLDRQAGGTWLGVNQRGLFAAVTNRRCESPDPARRSRGWLVMSALSEPSARRAAERIAALEATDHNPFNFFVADAESAHLVSCAEKTERFDLAPGAHVIGNAHPDERSPKLERLRREAEALCAGPAPTVDALGRLCRDHGGDSALEAACVHAGAYGTRSSTLLRVGGVPSLHHADGPPCTEPYRDLTPLLRELGLGRRAEVH
jgi:uncharacterized protein with NRDE domain